MQSAKRTTPVTSKPSGAFSLGVFRSAITRREKAVLCDQEDSKLTDNQRVWRALLRAAFEGEWFDADVRGLLRPPPT